MYENEDREPEIMERDNEGTLTVLTRAEIDTQIATAKTYPRSISRFKTQAASMATLDDETAASMFYSLPRDGKTVEGPSARFAEVAACAWGNLRFGARVVSDEGKFLTAQGVCHDLESNISITYEVQRRITKRNGDRYSDDMIVVTGNAASSIALRNAVLKVIPKAYWNPVLQQARHVAIGDAKTLASRRQQVFEYFGKMGVTKDRVLAVLEITSEEDFTLDHMATLTGLRTAIKDGDITVDDAFPAPKPPVGKGDLGGKPSTNGHKHEAKPEAPKKADAGMSESEKAEIEVADMIEQAGPDMVRFAASVLESKKAILGDAAYVRLQEKLKAKTPEPEPPKARGRKVVMENL